MDTKDNSPGLTTILDLEAQIAAFEHDVAFVLLESHSNGSSVYTYFGPTLSTHDGTPRQPDTMSGSLMMVPGLTAEQYDALWNEFENA